MPATREGHGPPAAGHVVAAPDKFRGTLTAAAAAAAIAAGMRAARPGLRVVCHPAADGGEGTVDACVRAGFARVHARVTGPDGHRLRAGYALREDTAVIELAAASGLARLPPGRTLPLTATTRGTGELIGDALGRGARRVVVGIGGSATTDGGAGLLRALGAELRDGAGAPVPDGGAALAAAARLDLAGLDPRLAATEILVASDVDNPLLGPHGAAAVYAPQKGAAPGEVVLLESGLRRWAGLVAEAARADLRDLPGAGAAGGTGFGLAAVLGARLVPGTDLLLRVTGFGGRLAGASLVVTGEGSLDSQSLRGKTPVGVARAAARAGVPTVAVCGRSSVTAGQAREAGLAGVYPLTDIEPDPALCRAHARPLLVRLAGRVAREWFPPAAAAPGGRG